MPHRPEDRAAAAALCQTMGVQIRRAREALGWSQERLAEAVGVGGAMLGRYERGAKFPSYVTLLRVAQVLRLSTDVLLGLKVESVRAAKAAQARDPLDTLPPRLRDAMTLVVAELTVKKGYARKSKARVTRKR